MVSKLLWTYHGLPYILGYNANGMMVSSTVLYFSEVVKAKDLWTFNLSNLEHRVYMVLASLNVVRLLPVLDSLCHEHNLESDTIVRGGERQVKLVRLYGSFMKKTFDLSDVCQHVLQICGCIRQCPHTECLHTEHAVSSSKFSILFQPHCSHVQRARPESELVKALINVVEALVWLHGKSWMHCDIQWPNIACFQDEWIVLDFNETCQAHKILCPETHAPEMITGRHDCSVDIWGVGHLIKTSKVLGLSPKLIQLQELCLNDNPSCRPYAQNVLQELMSLQRLGRIL